MQVVMCDTMIRVQGMNSVLRPLTRYVMSDYEARVYIHQERVKRGTGREDIFNEFTCSSFTNYEKRYAGQDLTNKRLGIYRHKAWGDSLIATSIPRYIKTLHPSVEIYFYCHPDVWDLHLGNQYLYKAMAVPIPISFDAARNFLDYHIFYEGMLENDSEPDQNNSYDAMFQFCGLDPPAIYKRPFIFPRPDDYEAVNYLRDDPAIKWNPDEKYILYHLSPANENRCYPPAMSRRFWQLFCANFSDYRIFVIGQADGRRRDPMFEGFDRVVNLLNRVKSFRMHVPLIERASLLICPDSSFGHLAACFPHVPVISLWGVFHPDNRVKYYGNHYPLHNFDVCRWAPCHNHEFDIPLHQCRKGGHWDAVREKYNAFCKKAHVIHDENTLDGYCAVLASIEPETILELADRLLKGHRSADHLRVEEAAETDVVHIKEDDYRRDVKPADDISG